jgi:hypothetical protein
MIKWRIVLEPALFVPEYLMYLSPEKFGLAQVSIVSNTASLQGYGGGGMSSQNNIDQWRCSCKCPCLWHINVTAITTTNITIIVIFCTEAPLLFQNHVCSVLSNHEPDKKSKSEGK